MSASGDTHAHRPGHRPSTGGGVCSAARMAHRCLVPALSLGLTAMLWGCAARGPAPVGGWDWTGPVPDGYHLVVQGDTLSELAERRGVGLETLARWNRLKAPYTIYAGRLLRIEPPDGSPPPRPAPAASPTAPDSRTTAPRVAAGTASGASSRTGGAEATPASRPPAPAAQGAGTRADSGVIWAWPLGGALAQGFQSGDRTRQGIRIRGRAGDQVKAAADGQVVYAGGGLKGYGNLIIVKHNDNYLSAYGFNRRLLVNEGDRVRRGQAVAEVGQAAGGTPLLHFEIRRDGTAVDPLRYLPPRT